MTLPILVNGANGKMGKQAVQALSAEDGYFSVITAGRGENLKEVIAQSGAKIVLDLTNADSVFQNTEIIINASAHPVIGTSGLLKKDVDYFKNLCESKKLGGLIVPNFSLGAVLLMKQAQEMARYFPDIEIIEMHHPGKLDSPSGTAIRTAEMLAEKRQSPPLSRTNKETLPGARGALYQDIPIHAVRLTGLLAHLQILFGGTGETITLRHDTLDRQCFMQGLVLACKKVTELNGLVVGLEHIL